MRRTADREEFYVPRGMFSPSDLLGDRRGGKGERREKRVHQRGFSDAGRPGECGGYPVLYAIADIGFQRGNSVIM